MLTRRRAPERALAPEPPPLAWDSLPRQFADLDCGRVAYLRHGSGPPLLLVHGIPTSSRLWEPLMGILGEHYDCIAPDLLGLGQSMPAHGADQASPGQAAMLAALLDHLGIDESYAVFHDQGGAHGMEFLRSHGARVPAVAFTNCVCYDNWPVPVIDASAALGRWGWVPWMARLRLMQATLSMVLPWTVCRGRIPPALKRDWFRALDEGGPALQAWVGYVTAQSARYTIEAEATLRAWDKPAHVLWAAQDRFLPVSWAVRLAQDLGGEDARPELLPFAGHFWQTELPESGARALMRFFDAQR